MDDFSITGSWWLPERPNRKLAGQLVYDADKSLHLELFDHLFEPDFVGDVVEVSDTTKVSAPIVHGVRHDNREMITLVGLQGQPLIVPAVFVSSPFIVDIALMGAHLTTTDFTEITVEFDYLRAWAESTSRVDTSNPDLAQMRTDLIDLGKLDLHDGLVLSLCTGVAGQWGDDATNLVEHAFFSLKTSSTRPWGELVDLALDPLQDLLTVSLGVPVRLIEMRFRTRAEQGRPVSVTAVLPRAQRLAREDEPTQSRMASQILDYQSPTLLTIKRLANKPSPLDFNRLLSGWFKQYDDAREVVAQLLAAFYAPFMSPEHRYSSTFQSAEALYDLLGFETRDLSKPEHRARVARVVQLIDASDLPAGDSDWAGKILSTRNDKSLPTKIDDLLYEAGAAGVTLLTAAPRFGTEAARLRARVSHGGTSGVPDRRIRLYYEHALRWIVRGHLICRLLDPAERGPFWTHLSDRHGFQSVVDGLAQFTAQTAKEDGADD